MTTRSSRITTLRFTSLLRIWIPACGPRSSSHRSRLPPLFAYPPHHAGGSRTAPTKTRDHGYRGLHTLGGPWVAPTKKRRREYRTTELVSLDGLLSDSGIGWVGGMTAIHYPRSTVPPFVLARRHDNGFNDGQGSRREGICPRRRFICPAFGEGFSRPIVRFAPSATGCGVGGFFTRLPFLSFTSLRTGERKNPRPRSLRPTLMPIAPTSGRPMGRPYECDAGADVDQMISPPFASS